MFQRKTEDKVVEQKQTLLADETLTDLSQKLKTKEELALAAALKYEMLNQQEKLLKARRDKEYRPIIEDIVKKKGIVDPKGNREFGDEFVTIHYNRRASVSFNSVAAEQILRKKKLYDACVHEVVTVEIDESKIMEAYQAGLISPKEFAQMFVESESFALKIDVSPDTIPEYDTLVKLRKEAEGKK